MTLFSIATAISGLLFFAILFCSSVAFGCECLYWLRFGVWPHWSITHVTGPVPLTGLIGLDRIIDEYLAYPLSGQIAFLGLILGRFLRCSLKPPALMSAYKALRCFRDIADADR